ncbi:hypothetical protein FGRMN_1446 [Fusarium graminum]|nr:hypothetical protein FGRMN_1446 [Fusarium graminum]
MWSRPSVRSLLLSFVSWTYGQDTSRPECVTSCSRNLTRYHNISTIGALCSDMAIQRELFLCLASLCTDHYGQSLTYAISMCSHYGASISNILPVELYNMSLFPGQSSPLVARSDTASFGFEGRFSLSVHCKAGSNGVLTLSLLEITVPAVSQPASGGESTGYGNGDSGAGTNPPTGGPSPNNDSSLGGTTGSNNGQTGTPTEGGDSSNSDGNNGADSLSPGAGCGGGGSEGGPSQSSNDNRHPEPQPQPIPIPAPAPPSKPSESDGPPQGGQPDELPANPADAIPSQPGANDGSNMPSGQSQPAPPTIPQLAPTASAQNPVPPTPEDSEMPDQEPGNRLEYGSTLPGPDAVSSVNTTTETSRTDIGGSADCSIYMNDPLCTSQSQQPHEPWVPTSTPTLAPVSSVPPASSTVPNPVLNPDQESVNGGYSNADLCSDPNAGGDCDSSEAPHLITVILTTLIESTETKVITV